MLHPAIIMRSNETIEGRGLMASAPIKRGEIISRLQAEEPRMTLAALYQLPIEEQEGLMHYCYQCDDDHIVCEQGIERFMNHSCDPNTWWADDNTMIARRDIAEGEEITYDYATTEISVPFSMTCLCGADNCRGVITTDDYKNPAWQAIFGEHLPSHTLRAIHQTLTLDD
jgi:SET domain-containing protein